jgi:hypothetical protein
MKTADFKIEVTSAKLHENLEKQFGSRVNLEKYDREQLEDIRNKFRTRIFQHESSAKINDLLSNESYQKDKAMLELLNTRIKEMLGEQMKQLRDKIDQLNENKKGVKAVKHTTKSKGSKPDFLDLDKDGDKKEPMKQAARQAKVKEGAKPDFLDLDKDGDKKEPMKKAAKEKNMKEAMKKMCPGCKKPINLCGCKGKDEKVKEAFPVPGETKEKTTGKFDKKKTSTGTVYTKKAEKADDKKSKKDDDLEEAKAHAKDCDCKECMAVYERDEGKHNNKTTGFKALAKKAGGGEKGAKIAGAQRQKMKKAGQLEESNFRHNVRFVNESINWLLSEDEEGKAKAITAAGDIVNDYTSWMQRVGQYQTKSMIELADAIRADFGAAEAEAFKGAVGPALSATLEVLTQQREAVSNAVAVLAGEAAPEEPMGAEPGMDAGMDAGMPPAAPDEMNPEAGADLGDEFAAADASSSNREMRESRVERRARKLAESHSIIAKLSR